MLRIYIPISALAIILFVGVVMTGLYNLYDFLPSFDKFMHLVAGFVVAWLAHALFRNSITQLPFVSRLVFLAGCVALIGVAWEIAEFFANNIKDIAPTFYYYFHGGGLADTLADMATNVLGGLVYALIFSRRS